MKRFQYCLNPNASKHFLFFRSIQGHSGDNLVDPAMQDNVLLPEDFTKYIWHIGNVSEIHSITRSGLFPEKKSQKREAIPVFHCREPDGRWSQHWRNSMRIGQAKDRTIHRYLETSYKYSVLVQFKARSEERIEILSNKTTRNRSPQHVWIVLRKRNAWRLGRSYTVKYTNLHGCLESYWSRIRKVDNRINLIKEQENFHTIKAHRTEVTGNL